MTDLPAQPVSAPWDKWFKPVYLERFILAVMMLSYVVYALRRGPDDNYDLRNYHIYNGYKFLHGVFQNNFFPSQFQNWHNPLTNSFVVLLMYHLPPMVVATVLAGLQSFNILVSWLVARQALQPLTDEASLRTQWMTPLMAALIGATAALFLSEAGTSFGDNLVSVPMLYALYLLGRAAAQDHDAWDKVRRDVALAGLCVGLACGLKLTIMVYLPGFALCFLWLRQPFLKLVPLAAIFGAAFLLSWGICDGWWMWDIWRTTGNPLFPQMNDVFRSPLLDPVDMSDKRFAAKSLGQGLLQPFRTAVGDYPGGEVYYRDFRFAAALLLLPFVAWRRPQGWGGAVVVFAVVGYFFWLKMFGIARFAIPIELLSGIVLCALIASLVPASYRLWAVAVLALLVIVPTVPAEWGHLRQWTYAGGDGNWYHVQVPGELMAPDEMFLHLDHQPGFAYIIPFFPEDARFMRMLGSIQPSPGTGLYDQRREAIVRHTGPIYALTSFRPNHDEAELLRPYGLRFNGKPCILVTSVVDVIAACPLDRVAP
jgi:hypothetical protein